MDTEVGSENAEMSDSVEQEWFLDRFQQLQAQGDGSLTLINVYKELPITHPGTIFDIKGARVQLETSELQLAAISQCNEVFIQAPLLGSTVRGELAAIDVRRNLVEVFDFCRASIKVEMRNTVRVRLKMPTNVVIHANGEEIGGVIHDVSVGGTCIKSMKRERLENAEKIELEAELLRGKRVRVDCSLVKVEGSSPPYKCSFRFNHTTHSEELLSLFVYQRQREILKELRDAL